ncbi:MAG: 2-C-methyl-D-erythritol 4-phosphate cytidylyltransferase [Deltaproteobacteria bacterium]
MYASAIILAAGKGTRFGSRVPKPFVRLAGEQVLSYCLKTFGSMRDIRQVIIAVSPAGRQQLTRLLKGLRLSNVHVVAGGSRRQDSVRNALRALDPRTEIVLIHDGVRPFADKDLTQRVIRAAADAGAAIAAVPAKNTIKSVRRAGGKLVVDGTPRRESLWEVQTPQAFRKDLILKAYCSCGKRSVTDDASLVERLGKPVAVVEGSYSNIKITTPEDLAIAEALK